MTKSILDLATERIVLLDGGFGTELIRHGFPQGACPETWNIENPPAIQAIHRSYFEAGSDAVQANSFGGSTIKLAAHGLEKRCYELNRAAAEVANAVKPAGRFVGGSIGPTGKFLKPQGPFTEPEFEESFAEQARGLSDGQADFLIIETQYDLREALCALRGARRVSSLPVFVTMTYNHVPRGFFTLMGNSVAACLEALENEGASAGGSNCTLDSGEMAGLVKEMRALTSLPLIAQANAGKPSLSVEGQVAYSQGLDDYVKHVPEMAANGANFIGGCCGTDPDYIRRMAELLRKIGT
jgi:5-methyltetrahydrofolate--homocysteine methyltransferase